MKAGTSTDVNWRQSWSVVPCHLPCYSGDWWHIIDEKCWNPVPRPKRSLLWGKGLMISRAPSKQHQSPSLLYLISHSIVCSNNRILEICPQEISSPGLLQPLYLFNFISQCISILQELLSKSCAGFILLLGGYTRILYLVGAWLAQG